MQIFLIVYSSNMAACEHTLLWRFYGAFMLERPATVAHYYC